jgi:hypothetical protein
LSVTARLVGRAAIRLQSGPVPERTRDLFVGAAPDRPRTASGEILQVPAGWQLLPPGDAGLTRRVKAAGPTWTIREPKGRKLFSRGLWAPGDTIARERAKLEQEREDPRWAQRLDAGRRRRDAAQAAYVEEFFAAVYRFLAFAPRHRELAALVAKAITDHAVPVGSGTVARTQRIPIERRAEAATIAWLRHQTTAYDTMAIPRVRGMRREVRRMLAEQSRRVLARYRNGEAIDDGCVLRRALAR